MSSFPLARITDTQLHRIGQVLWSWPRCDECDAGKACTTDECATKRSKRLTRYFEYYKGLTRIYEPDIGPSETAALKNHEDLFEIIRRLKMGPNLSRAQLAESLFGNQPGQSQAALADRECAIHLAVKVMAMVNCSASYQTPSLLEHGAFQIPWRDAVPFSQFMSDIFPLTDHPGLSDHSAETPSNMRAALTAKKLKKRAGIKFYPTDDLRRHLRLDRKSRVVEIYHQTAFLKEHLRLTKDSPRNSSISDSLKVGALPRQLALEALDSIQKVLFPLSDAKSRALLQSLVSTASFDPDCLRFESATIRTADEKEISYHYFGARLADLYEELENPQPRGWIEKWLERKSGARYLMMATLIGVLIALVLGFASLAVSAYQAWVAYQAWQRPISLGAGTGG